MIFWLQWCHQQSINYACVVCMIVKMYWIHIHIKNKTPCVRARVYVCVRTYVRVCVCLCVCVYEYELCMFYVEYASLLLNHFMHILIVIYKWWLLFPFPLELTRIVFIQLCYKTLKPTKLCSFSCVIKLSNLPNCVHSAVL